MSADLVTVNNGSFVILRPLTRRGTIWCRRNLSGDALPKRWRNIAVDYRYISDIVHNAVRDGLYVRDDGTGLYALEHVPAAAIQVKRERIFNVSLRKVGAIWFLRIGRLGCSFWVSKARARDE